MKTYKTKDGTQNGFIPGVGVIVNGTITTEQIIENPNLVEVTEEQPAAPVASPAVAAPAPVPVPAAVVQPTPQILNKETN